MKHFEFKRLYSVFLSPKTSLGFKIASYLFLNFNTFQIFNFNLCFQILFTEKENLSELQKLIFQNVSDFGIFTAKV